MAMDEDNPSFKIRYCQVKTKVLPMQNNKLQSCLSEAERTIHNKDVIINMLQDQLHKMEQMFMRNLDENEDMRFKYCKARQELKQVKDCNYQQMDLLNNTKCPGQCSITEIKENQEEIKTKTFCTNSTENAEISQFIFKVDNLEKLIREQSTKLNEIQSNVIKQESEMNQNCDSTMIKCDTVADLRQEIAELRQEIIKLMDVETYKSQRNNELEKSLNDIKLKSKESMTNLEKQNFKVKHKRSSTSLNSENEIENFVDRSFFAPKNLQTIPEKESDISISTQSASNSIKESKQIDTDYGDQITKNDQFKHRSEMVNTESVKADQETERDYDETKVKSKKLHAHPNKIREDTNWTSDESISETLSIKTRSLQEELTKTIEHILNDHKTESQKELSSLSLEKSKPQFVDRSAKVPSDYDESDLEHADLKLVKSLNDSDCFNEDNNNDLIIKSDYSQLKQEISNFRKENFEILTSYKQNLDYLMAQHQCLRSDINEVKHQLTILKYAPPQNDFNDNSESSEVQKPITSSTAVENLHPKEELLPKDAENNETEDDKTEKLNTNNPSSCCSHESCKNHCFDSKKASVTGANANTHTLDSIKMLTAHYNDLQREHVDKKNQIRWLADIISCYNQIGAADTSCCSNTIQEISTEHLQNYVEKIVEENNKVKSTINYLMSNLQDSLEITNYPYQESPPKPPITPLPPVNTCCCKCPSLEEPPLEQIWMAERHSCNKNKPKPVDKNIGNYLHYLQKQLEVTSAIEKEIDCIRNELKTRHESYQQSLELDRDI